MPDTFARILLGHLVGDYLLQSRTMALEKSKKDARGLWWCNLHCLLYTMSVCLFLWTLNPLAISLVFLSHWPFDRYSLASKWLKLMGGRDIITAYNSTEKFHEVDLIFSCLVYTVTDNTIHLILLWLITRFVI